jgi:hypothetical protein
LSTLYEELENLPYYQGTNAAKLRQLSNSVETEALNERRSEIEAIFSDETYSRKDLEEMGMFPLQINVLHLPGKSQSKVS